MNTCTRRLRQGIWLPCVAWAVLLTACAPDPDPMASDGSAAGGEAGPSSAVAPPDYAALSRELATRFGRDLKAELQQAMTREGPAAAVEVCRDRAPAIAAELSRSSGATVGRTSLRVRNPANAAEEWQVAVLEQFDDAMPLAPDAPPPEYERALTEGPHAYRYMRAIGAGGLCLTCHGRTLAPEVQAVLDRLYPDDAATGYDAGQLRGAFVVTWPRSQ